MPDHLHLLVRGFDVDSDAYAACHSFKVGAGRWVKANIPSVSLQKDFYDTVIKQFEGWFERATYIFENPVRAGLVFDPRDWPFTTSIGHELNEVLSRHS